MAALAKRLQLVAQLRQRRIVAGAETGERHLLIAGIIAGIQTILGAQIPAAVADGTVDIPCLTEAAAPDTAPEQLQHHPILHDLRGGHNGIDREIGLVHIMNDTLGHHGGCAVMGRNGLHRTVVVVGDLIQAGDIDAVQPGSGPQKFRLAPSLPTGPAVKLHQLHGDILALAKADKVDEIGNRLGVVHGCAAGDHQRRQAVALGAAQGDPGQIQHIENGGEGHLIAHGKGHNVKIRDGIAGFQTKQRNIRPAHFLLHVAPGRKDALAPHALHLVHDAIKDPHAQIGHADLVGIRKAKGNAGIHLRLILDDCVIFAAHITGGLLHAGQDPLQLLIHNISPIVS